MDEFEELFKNNPDEMFLGVTIEERIATLSGQLAMIELMKHDRPDIARFRAFHQLRVAARHCPNAAYNIGNYLSDDKEKRRRRQKLAMELFLRATEMGMSRLRNVDEPYAKAPRREGALRDIISRALTNIGAKVSNAGKPMDAVPYFKQSIAIYPKNPNSHVCLGNMGVMYSDMTGISPIEGVREWKEAGKIGDYCHESRTGCPCRATVVRVVESIARNYGDAAANEWMTTRYAKSCETRKSTYLVHAIASAADAKMIGVTVPSPAAAASKLIADNGFVDRLRGEALEARVTVMASAIATFLNMAGRPPHENIRLLQRAKDVCKDFEPLKAILGEEDWRYVGPPDTDYLVLVETRERLARFVFELVLPVAEATSLEKGLDGVIAMLSHLDISFREGVAAMVEYDLPYARPGVPVYIPAPSVGRRPTQ